MQLSALESPTKLQHAGKSVQCTQLNSRKQTIKLFKYKVSDIIF